MLVTMRDAPGVGLAANQVGVPLQVAVIEIEGRITELVNPQIVKSSGEQLDWEGCLSIPGYVAEVTRAAKVTVKAKDRHGREFRVKGEGLFARALQHEIDHLNGGSTSTTSTTDAELVRVSEAHDEVAEETPPASSGGHRADRVPGHRRVRCPAARTRRRPGRRAARRQPAGSAGRTPAPAAATPIATAARERGIRVLTPARLRSDEAREELARFDPDGLVLVAYGQIVPPGCWRSGAGRR